MHPWRSANLPVSAPAWTAGAVAASSGCRRRRLTFLRRRLEEAATPIPTGAGPRFRDAIQNRIPSSDSEEAETAANARAEEPTRLGLGLPVVFEKSAGTTTDRHGQIRPALSSAADFEIRAAAAAASPELCSVRLWLR